uniref:Uncharacterized protein n=1 Tax=Arion vulgaris TaxID=1028688 RepID=A0A0B7AME7_9EUPU
MQGSPRYEWDISQEWQNPLTGVQRSSPREARISSLQRFFSQGGKHARVFSQGGKHFNFTKIFLEINLLGHEMLTLHLWLTRTSYTSA